MKKYFIPLIAIMFLAFGANAQIDSTKVIDNKGTIKYVIKASSINNIISKKDSLILYVTPKQLGDSLTNYVQYSDTAAMLMNYLNSANNGLTKVGQNVKLGGALTENTTISSASFDLIFSIAANDSLKIQGLGSGSASSDSVVVVDPNTGALKRISASTLFNALTFGNGLTKTGNLVELGGSLTKATTITTTVGNTLAIDGLQSGSRTDSIVLVDPTTGVLKRISAASLNNTKTYTVNSGLPLAGTATAYIIPQVTSTIPATYTTQQVWVFRNGAKLVAGIDYTVAGGVVTITPQTGNPLEDWVWGVYERIELQWVE